VLDLFSVLPLDYVLWIGDFSSPLIAWCRVLRLLKVFRVAAAIRYMKHDSNIRTSLFSLFLMFFLFLFLAHFAACIYFAVGCLEYEHGERFDGKSLFKDMVDRPFANQEHFVPDLPIHY